MKLRRPTHPLYCTRNLKGNFRIGMRTEKFRLRRSLMSFAAPAATNPALVGPGTGQHSQRR
ncbi:MAG TPA: hypothetical protein VJ723_13505, partial [Candidatus Angelobacter sp.]|nr:hypothetical protein [Candidatus Angelobacter sp.]